MKKVLLLFLVCLGFVSLQSQEISNEQWTLITKKTADWCPFCGQWGWEFKDQLLEDNADKPVVFWMAHYSGGLETPTADAIVSNLGGGGQPLFYLNTDNMGVFNGNRDEKAEEFRIIVESLSLFEPLAGVGSTATYDGETITSTARVEFFFEQEGGEYWLSSYLVDDVLEWEQAGQNGLVEHQNILLHSMNGDNYFGENVSSDQVVPAGQEYTVEGLLDFETDDISGYSIVTILWTLVDGQYFPFNMNRQSIEMVSSTINELENLSLTAFQLNSGQVQVDLNSDIVANQATVNLFDMSGKLIIDQQIDIQEGMNNVLLNTPVLSTGTYIVNIQSDKGNRSIKVVLR